MKIKALALLSLALNYYKYNIAENSKCLFFLLNISYFDRDLDVIEFIVTPLAFRGVRTRFLMFIGLAMTHLYLFPNLLDAQASPSTAFPPETAQHFSTVEFLIAESLSGARHYCKMFGRQLTPNQVFLCNEHSTPAELKDLFVEMAKGGVWGLISDAGIPCIADPGAQIVFHAQEQGWTVEPIVGPCSIVLGLMLSGLSGQNFYSVGYLPRDKEELKKRIIQLTLLSTKESTTIVAIEAPYRTKSLFLQLLETLPAETYLSVGLALTSPQQKSKTAKVSQWKRSQPELFCQEKFPAIFCWNSSR